MVSHRYFRLIGDMAAPVHAQATFCSVLGHDFDARAVYTGFSPVCHSDKRTPHDPLPAACMRVLECVLRLV